MRNGYRRPAARVWWRMSSDQHYLPLIVLSWKPKWWLYSVGGAKERENVVFFLTAVVKPNVSIAILDMVGESFDLFGDGGPAAIVVKVGGGAAVVGGGGVLKPFPGAGCLDWISRIDVGGLDGSLAVFGAHFPWGVFILVQPCAAKGV